jgi:chitin synthase
MGPKHTLEDDEEGDRDDNTDYTHQTDGGLIPPTAGYFADSADDLLLTGTGNDGAPYQSPNTQYDFGWPQNRGVWDSDYDKKDPRSPGMPVNYSPRDAAKEIDDMPVVVKEAPNTAVEIPSTKSRRYWLWIVWLTTWWMPNFMLRIVGRMERPDLRLARREKVTIFWLIFLLNALVIFYIVEFGRLLCPNFDKAWGASEVAQHQASGFEWLYWVLVQGVVYGLSNFINGDHSNGYFGVASNSSDILDALAGKDLTSYFPPSLVSACSGLVTDGTLTLTRKNFTNEEPQAQRISGQLQTTVPDMMGDNWYKDTFLTKMQTMKKGTLVIMKQTHQ